VKTSQTRKTKEISPDEALDFLDAFQKMLADQDEPSTAISLRVPANILRSFKTLAKAQDRPYQRMMIQALREYLERSRNPR
jgi:predicted DNA binding CopG/RHH family protein